MHAVAVLLGVVTVDATDLTPVDYSLADIGVNIDSTNCKYDYRDWLFGITCSSDSPYIESWYNT